MPMRSIRGWVLALIGILTLATTVRAQDPAPTRRFATMFGLIGDSLRGGPLAGAKIRVVNTTRETFTNMRGQYVLDSVPVGQWQVAIEHPFLDSLGLAVVSPPIDFPAGQRVDVSASTPSLAEFKLTNCNRNAALSAGPMIVFGRVIDADNDRPMENAALSFVYRDVTNGTNGPERVRQARTNAKGAFAICGLPEAVTGSLQVTFGATGKSEIQIKHSADRAPIEAVRFVVGSGPSVAAVTGRVTARTGAPVVGAQVTIAGTTATASTNADGRFALDGLPPGTQMLQVRKVGYAVYSLPVELSTKRVAEVAVAMSDAAQALAAVKVVGEFDEGLERVGFNDRKRLTQGSRFMGPKEIEDLRPLLATDLLRQLPGFKVSSQSAGRIIESTRSAAGTTAGCVTIFIDRSRFDQIEAGDLDRALPVKIIGAIETYTALNSIPTEFTVNAVVCPTIAIWTKGRLQAP
jgi:hypothetical protein